MKNTYFYFHSCGSERNMQLWIPACGGSGANCLLNASPYRPARLWLQEAIQKEKERSIKLVAQEKGWLMDKAANYHAAFMSVCGPGGLHILPPIIHVRPLSCAFSCFFVDARPRVGHVLCGHGVNALLS